MSTQQVILALTGHRFPLHSEKAVQDEIAKLLTEKNIFYNREMELDKENRPDFMAGTTAIEVKISGQARAIYRQCERYCSFDLVTELVLITNKALGFPHQINGKNCYVINLGRAWL